MAIYKGRSVQIIATTPETPVDVKILHKDGTIETVAPSKLHFTKVELDKITKNTAIITDPKDPNYNTNYKLIADRDHQELLDGQDPVKMEAALKARPNPQSEIAVPAQTVRVHPQVNQVTDVTEADKHRIKSTPEVMTERNISPYAQNHPQVTPQVDTHKESTPPSHSSLSPKAK